MNPVMPAVAITAGSGVFVNKTMHSATIAITIVDTSMIALRAISQVVATSTRVDRCRIDRAATFAIEIEY